MTDTVRTPFAGNVPVAAPPRGCQTEEGRGLSIRWRIARVLEDPLLRNGHSLMVSSASSSLIGMAYWMLAARHYDAAVVGRNTAAISALTFLSAIAELNLMSTLMRFLPSAGRRTWRFVALAYAASAVVALLLAAVFLIVLPWIEPSLGFLRNPALGAWFVASTVAGAIFVLQDSVLTGLRATHWVPVENIAFALVKVALVVILASSLADDGIFVSWTIAMVVAVIPTNAYLFLLGIPRHQRREAVGIPPPTGAEIRSYMVPDYLAAMCWIALVNLMPLLVIDVAGARANAHFAMAWIISYTLYLLGINMGSALIVETAVDQSQLSVRCRKLLVHNSRILVPTVAAVVLLAPYILSLFGPKYASGGALTLRLLALSAIPALLTSTVVAACRAQRRMRMVLGTMVVTCALVFSLSAVLIQHLGITGIGIAWLTTEVVLAGVFLAWPRLWLADAREPLVTARVALAEVAVGMAGSLIWRVAGLSTGVPSFSFRNKREAIAELEELVPIAMSNLTVDGSLSSPTTPLVKLIPTVSDLTVAILRLGAGGPRAVVKVPRSDLALDDLLQQERALASLRRQPHLSNWCQRLVPNLEVHPGGSRGFAMEQLVPGAPLGEILASNPGVGMAAVGAALRAIGDLHSATGSLVEVDSELIRSWSAEPLALVSKVSVRIRGEAIQRYVEVLARQIQQGLLGTRLVVSQTHGDLGLGNVLGSPEGEVTGIIDWGLARSDGVAVLDSLLLIASARARLSGRQLGRVVLQFMEDGIPEDDRRLLIACGSRLPETGAAERALVLLCWLQHVGANLQKSHRYSNHSLWLASNVIPVLRAAAR